MQVAGLRSIVDDVIQSLNPDIGDREVEWKIGDLPYVECDTALMYQVWQNLLSNALKFTRPRSHAVIAIGQEQRDGKAVVYLRDNGVGFSMKYADKLFGVFQRLHRAEDYEGTGVGLAIGVFVLSDPSRSLKTLAVVLGIYLLLIGTLVIVRTATDEFVARRAVLATVEPQRLFLDLVGTGHLPADFVRLVRRFRYHAAASCVSRTASRSCLAVSPLSNMK